MTIKVGDRLPDGVLSEFIETEQPGCAIGPNNFNVSDLAKRKKIVIFGLPGAFTPTCSAKHAPGYVANHDALKAKGVNEIWCVSVNDAFVMGAWARDQKSAGKVRMKRFSMLVEDGVVKKLNVEAPGKFEVSNAETMLAQV